MKIKIKKFKSISLYILAPVILVLVLIFLIYQSNQRIKFLKQGIDLKPRPFSELIALDFAGIKEEPADPSKCDGTKIIKFLSEVKTSTAQVNWFKDYDPNVHKLTVLDNCWRQYENEYVKFKFRDLNGSLRMDRENSFEIQKGDGFYSFGIWRQNKSKDLVSSILDYVKMQRIKAFVSMKTFSNPNNILIFRLNDHYYSPLLVNEVAYIVDLPSENYYLYIWGKSDQVMKDILSTIELKK